MLDWQQVVLLQPKADTERDNQETIGTVNTLTSKFVRHIVTTLDSSRVCSNCLLIRDAQRLGTDALYFFDACIQSSERLGQLTRLLKSEYGHFGRLSTVVGEWKRVDSVLSTS